MPTREIYFPSLLRNLSKYSLTLSPFSLALIAACIHAVSVNMTVRFFFDSSYKTGTFFTLFIPFPVDILRTHG